MGDAPDEKDLRRIGRKVKYDEVTWLGPRAGAIGGTLDNIEGARAQIMAGHETGTQVLAGLEQQYKSLEEVQDGLRHGTTGSNQAEAEQANAQLKSAMEKIDEARQQVAQALQEFEGVAQRL
jgi:methyl-accepting chemotaxis protein